MRISGSVEAFSSQCSEVVDRESGYFSPTTTSMPPVVSGLFCQDDDAIAVFDGKSTFPSLWLPNASSKTHRHTSEKPTLLSLSHKASKSNYQSESQVSSSKSDLRRRNSYSDLPQNVRASFSNSRLMIDILVVLKVSDGLSSSNVATVRKSSGDLNLREARKADEVDAAVLHDEDNYASQLSEEMQYSSIPMSRSLSHSALIQLESSHDDTEANHQPELDTQHQVTNCRHAVWIPEHNEDTA